MRSVNLIGQEQSSDPIDLFFIFQWTPVCIHEERGHSQQNFFCDTVQCFCEEKCTVGNYLHFTLHLHRYFRVEKQR